MSEIRPPMAPLIRRFAATNRRSVEELTGPCRTKDLVSLRRTLMRELFAEGFSPSAIARRMNRDHTTVLYHCGRLSGRAIPGWSGVTEAPGLCPGCDP